MLGFSPLATIPLADILLNASTAVTGQSLSLTQNSVDEGIFGAVNVSGFSLALAQGALDLITDINLTLDSQTITTAQNNLSITSGAVHILLKQVDLVATLSSVIPRVSARIAGEAIASSQNSVSTIAGASTILTAQSPLTLTQNGTYEAVTFRAPSQTIHTSLNSMRMWNKINTAQSPGWTEIET